MSQRLLTFMAFPVVPQEYGGYVTSLLVSGEESPVKCGAILSPITDFELYGKQIVLFLCVCAAVPAVVSDRKRSGSRADYGRRPGSRG